MSNKYCTVNNMKVNTQFHRDTNDMCLVLKLANYFFQVYLPAILLVDDQTTVDYLL